MHALQLPQPFSALHYILPWLLSNMKNPRRDRLEYLLYATVMTSCTVALGLGIVFGFDEQGNRRKPVMDQPFAESWREAQLELYNYRIKKETQLERWAKEKGFGNWFFYMTGLSERTNSGTETPKEETHRRPPSYLESATADYPNVDGKK